LENCREDARRRWQTRLEMALRAGGGWLCFRGFRAAMKIKFWKFSSVRMKLVGSVLLLIMPALLVMYICDLPSDEFLIGILAMVAAWMGGEYFVRRQAHQLSETARKIADGDLAARTGLPDSDDELGQLAKMFDRMASALELRIKEREKLAAFAQLNPNPAMEFTADGTMVYFNDSALQLALSIGKNHPREVLPERTDEIIFDCLATGKGKLRLETKISGRTVSWSFHPMLPSRVVHGYAEDITQRLSLEEQLRQSQKMESIGQLASGVAHDFNNMLTIIQGHTSALLAEPSLPPEIADPVQAVYFAAERAAGLTRQLLMFSRKNIMQLKPLDLREVVGNMGKMMERLIGENIRLKFNPPEKFPLVQGDTGMIEQVVMNLVVNARDAMPRGGTLTVSLIAMSLDAIFAEMHPQSRVGNFVCLRVNDTGCGMDAATLGHIFEPFFTTKDVGKGTGLGLATVYGIVKQHEGWVEVSSEPGKGSTFDILFPAIAEPVAPAKKETTASAPVAGGTETILIVEDEEILREMARDILEGCGYKIFEAASGKEAFGVWSLHMDEIKLLLTDMVMPEGVSGIDLAERLLTDRPDLKIIFSSGYTSTEISAELMARSQARFLQKPYSHTDLAKIVRDCLDTKGIPDSKTVAP
jgi:nitrogen-specific signal transduction histidine kinase/ActR/RegA family two-component response regulator/HAMP domain-containing protein